MYVQEIDDSSSLLFRLCYLCDFYMYTVLVCNTRTEALMGHRDFQNNQIFFKANRYNELYCAILENELCKSRERITHLFTNIFYLRS